MFNGSNCDRKSQLSGILTDPLNSRGLSIPRACPVYTLFCTKIMVTLIKSDLWIYAAERKKKMVEIYYFFQVEKRLYFYSWREGTGYMPLYRWRATLRKLYIAFLVVD